MASRVKSICPRKKGIRGDEIVDLPSWRGRGSLAIILGCALGPRAFSWLIVRGVSPESLNKSTRPFDIDLNLDLEHLQYHPLLHGHLPHAATPKSP
jgi:hypothetical protein